MQRVAGAILAAGTSSRFSSGNKLLARVQGVPVIRRVANAYVNAQLSPVLVILPPADRECEEALQALPVTIIENNDHLAGMSTSLRLALSRLPADVSALVLGVADQPFLTDAVIRAEVELYRRSGRPVIVPRYAGNKGSPVLFDHALFAELSQVQGDRGGREVVEAHAEEAGWVDIPDARIGQDIDTVEDYEALRWSL